MDLSKKVGAVIICGNSPALLSSPLPHQMCQTERNISYIVTRHALTRYTPNRKRNTDVTKVTSQAIFPEIYTEIFLQPIDLDKDVCYNRIFDGRAGGDGRTKKLAASSTEFMGFP